MFEILFLEAIMGMTGSEYYPTSAFGIFRFSGRGGSFKLSLSRIRNIASFPEFADGRTDSHR